MRAERDIGTITGTSGQDSLNGTGGDDLIEGLAGSDRIVGGDGAVPPGPDRPERENVSVNKEAKVDMALEVDWIRFARPRPAAINDWYAQVSGANKLADPNLPEAEVLRLLGG